VADPQPAYPRPESGLVLERIAQRCVDELAVDDAAIAVATGSKDWTPAYATSAVTARLEQYAFTIGEGPCTDVLRGHAPLMEADLHSPSAGDRWPAWSRAADESRIRSVTAFPIRAGAITAGVLTLYSGSVCTLNAARYLVALRLADLAFVGLLDLMAGLVHSADDLGSDEDSVTDLLRADVHRAAGMVMGQAGIPIDQALARLRAHAYSSGRPISEVAADVLARRLRFESDERSAE
jgi:hypothetical protein